MTEKEKMLAGLLYLPFCDDDDTLSREREHCKRLCSRYNQLLYSQPEEAIALLHQLLGPHGKEIWIEPPFWCDYGYGISTGENFYMNHGCVILDAGTVTFGDNVQVGPLCGFHTSGHPLDAAERQTGQEFGHPIRVGNNVWIGAGVQVMPGVTIGDNTVIGAGSVVTKDIPAGVVAVGNPCRVLRPITAADKMLP